MALETSCDLAGQSEMADAESVCRQEWVLFEEANGREDSESAQRAASAGDHEDLDLALAMRLQEEELVGDRLSRETSTGQGSQRARELIKPAFQGVTKIQDLPMFVLKEEQVKAFAQGDSQDHSSCIICLTEYTVGDKMRMLPCMHKFHMSCIDPWLTTSPYCPMCKLSVRTGQFQMDTPTRRMTRVQTASASRRASAAVARSSTRPSSSLRAQAAAVVASSAASDASPPVRRVYPTTPSSAL
eukprot:Tamp_12853.p1 GENE.Tamp_12853~~Tamp_12853.p1  ORF type:complete len:243 (-),score=44.85 Tamp_12853:1045-1773(-)